jgi:hypothetical protein
MLTTAGMILRSIGASVGKPRTSADVDGATEGIGVEGGGPGSGAGCCASLIHHQPMTARATTRPITMVLRTAETLDLAAAVDTDPRREQPPLVQVYGGRGAPP